MLKLFKRISKAIEQAQTRRAERELQNYFGSCVSLHDIERKIKAL